MVEIKSNWYENVKRVFTLDENERAKIIAAVAGISMLLGISGGITIGDLVINGEFLNALVDNVFALSESLLGLLGVVWSIYSLVVNAPEKIPGEEARVENLVSSSIYNKPTINNTGYVKERRRPKFLWIFPTL